MEGEKLTVKILDLTKNRKSQDDDHSWEHRQIAEVEFELEFTALIGVETLTCLTIILTNMIFLIAILK